MEDVDVVVVGGGPAGCAAAAALADLKLSVLQVDAGVDRHKQLAGERLHPTGVRDLRVLGLGAVVDAWRSETVRGFAVHFQAPARTITLPYGKGVTGLSLEHCAHKRRPAQRTRVTLASTLYSTFAGKDEGMRALRQGLMHYWEHSPHGTRASLALLTSEEPRMRVMTRENLRVLSHALIAMLSPWAPVNRRRSAAPLVRASGPPLRDAMASAVEQAEGWLHSHVRRPVYRLIRASEASPRRAFASRR
ncbi:MAG: hypothetical protein EOO71_02895 [Myxococcaceae bacterium]|nr:MAG: hypothetical protein EOO71_02895 [Myxococcaceae bacterium]